MKLYVVLGCYGRCDDGFVSCSGLRNRILYVNPSDPYYNDLMNYLDNLQLFDKVLMNYNAVRHFIFKIQDKFERPTEKVWSEKMFRLYQKFVIDHKDCGVFIDLEIDE